MNLLIIIYALIGFFIGVVLSIYFYRRIQKKTEAPHKIPAKDYLHLIGIADWKINIDEEGMLNKDIWISELLEDYHKYCSGEVISF